MALSDNIQQPAEQAQAPEQHRAQQQPVTDMNRDAAISRQSNSDFNRATPRMNSNSQDNSTSRQSEFQQSQAVQQQPAQQAENERSRQDESQRRANEAATMQRLEDNRRRRDMEASQRYIERQEAEKRDIARSGPNDSFNRYRQDTRDMRIQNERRRMEGY